jgi:hypothetical protein
MAVHASATHSGLEGVWALVLLKLGFIFFAVDKNVFFVSHFNL